MPLFSWDKVPIYNHLCNKSGPFNSDALAFLSRFPMVTIEKGQGSNNPGYAEDKIIGVAKQLKALNESIQTIFYYNSVLDWNQYRLHEEFLQHPSYWLQNASGEPVRIPGDHTFKQPKDGMLVFDFGQQVVRDFWASDCINATKTGFIDGCFVDRAGEDTFGGNKLTPEVAKAYAEGHIKVAVQLQNSVPGVVIANNDQIPGVKATMLEGFQANEQSIKHMMQVVKEGYMVQAHAGYSGEHCKDIENSLAAFLIAAGQYSYYGCSRTWYVDAEARDWLTWHPEYDKPLGHPVGDATLHDDVYERHFASGAVVQFNRKTNEGMIKWAGETRRGMRIRQRPSRVQ